MVEAIPGIQSHQQGLQPLQPLAGFWIRIGDVLHATHGLAGRFVVVALEQRGELTLAQPPGMDRGCADGDRGAVAAEGRLPAAAVADGEMQINIAIIDRGHRQAGGHRLGAAGVIGDDPAASILIPHTREQIERTAVDISSINPDVEIGSGRIDACAALAPFVGQQPAQPTPETPDQSAQPTPALPGRPDVPGRPAPDPGRILMLLLVPVVACVLVFGGALLLIIMLVRAVTGGGRSGRAAPPPPAAAGAMGPVLTVNGPGGVQRYQIAGGASLIGRDAGCTIVISGDPTISRRHAVLRVEPQGMTLEDAGSSHGTFVNNRRITGATVLRRGDQLSFGQTRGRID